MSPVIGSVCTGYGGLEIAARMLYPQARVAWHSEYDPDPEHRDSAARLLKWRYPDIPNHGNLAAMPWEDVETVDILCGGFPCQGQSLAGKRAGTDDERWLFDAIADGVGRMGTPPGLLVFENVPGLLTVQGGDAMARVVQRLAALGYVGSWRTVRASDVGACHRRERVVIVARHAEALGRDAAVAAAGRVLAPGAVGRPDGGVVEDSDLAVGGERRDSAPGQAPGRRSRADAGRRGGAPADTPVPGRQGGRVRGHSPRRGGSVAAVAPGDGRQQGRPEPARLGRGPDAPVGGTTPADARSARLGELARGAPGEEARPQAGVISPGDRGARADRVGRGVAAADATRDGQPVEPAGDHRIPQRPESGAGPGDSGGRGAPGTGRRRSRARVVAPTGEAAADAGGSGRERGTGLGGTRGEAPERGEALDIAEFSDLAQWGPYYPAIRRHERALGRVAPAPTVPRGRGGKYRLNPAFVEWMMMLPAGHVTDCPELTANQMLHILGNGVVPPSIAVAIADLLGDLP